MANSSPIRHEKRNLKPHPKVCKREDCLCRLRPKRRDIETCNIVRPMNEGPCVIAHVPPSHALRLQDWFMRKYPGELNINISTPHFLRIRFNKTSIYSPRSFLNEMWTQDTLKKYFNATYILEYNSRRVDHVALNAKLISPEIKRIRIVAPKKDCEVLVPRLPDDIVLDPREFSHILFAIRANRRWWWGIQPKAGLTFMHKGLSKTHEICRAELKLKEVFDLFGISGPFRATLDIGSSPGGWTKVLSTISGVTVSVDPGVLHPAVLSASGVVHIRKKVEDAIDELKSFSPFELIVCDINAPFSNVAQSDTTLDIVHKAAPLLSPTGGFVLTLKMVSKSLGANDNLATEMANLLRGSLFSSVDIVHLLSNSRRERTLYLNGPITQS